MISDRETATHLYRIAQEAISNAVRHGHATSVLIRLAIDSGEVVLSVRDNGLGFKPSAGACTGMGMRSMRYRTNLLNGSIDISAEPEGGALVCCRAPHPPAASNSVHAS